MAGGRGKFAPSFFLAVVRGAVNSSFLLDLHGFRLPALRVLLQLT